MTDETELTLRPEVAAFAQLMEQALRDNDYKGGWSDCDVRDLLARMKEETVELENELAGAREPLWIDWDPETAAKQPVLVKRHADGQWFQAVPSSSDFRPTADEGACIGSEAADVANFAMMIADHAGALQRRTSQQAGTEELVAAAVFARNALLGRKPFGVPDGEEACERLTNALAALSPKTGAGQ